MSNMFEEALQFNQEIGSWDTSKVANMEGMFAGATAFNKKIGGWSTSSVTDMSNMFDRAAEFNQEIGSWDTSKVANMEGMFDHAEHFNYDISSWRVCSAREMSNMFCGALSFTSLKVLETSWQMAPAACGESKREPTQREVKDCFQMRAASPSSSPSLKAASSFYMWVALCFVGGVVVSAALLARVSSQRRLSLLDFLALAPHSSAPSGEE
eukprot:2239819-Amphidinium_carterae.1